MALRGERFDVVVIGGGIAGNALGAVLARAGKSVLILERSTEYRDRVRGELLQPWGVAEAIRLGLHETLISRGVHHTRAVPYDETVEPTEAEAAAVPMDKILPDVPGSLGVGHPSACEALGVSAKSAGAQVLRGVTDVDMDLGTAPSVRYRCDGGDHTVECRLVVGADGRDSAVRRRAGLAIHTTEPRLRCAGLLVADVRGWPPHEITIGTEGDLVFFVLPQGGGRVRLYLFYTADQRHRFVGASASRTFLDSFAFTCIPASERIVRAIPVGPCAAYPMNDSWTDVPFANGLVLIGDAAGYSDPHCGQGLSVALRDVRMVSELLLAGDDWSSAALQPYAAERAERMRRLRFSAAVLTTLRGEFGPEARERRRRAKSRMQAAPELGLWRLACHAGPDSVPASAFDERVPERLFAR